MLEFKSFTYLDLEKTGCTFLRDALAAICEEPPVADVKHAPLATMTGKPRIMTIRHPLNYFLSLWKYGLDGLGGFYGHYHASHPMAYAERTPRSFKCFLNLALTAGSLVIGGQPLSTDIYTLRIINQLVPVQERDGFYASLDGDLSPHSLVANLGRFLPDELLRTEALNRDFHALADAGRLGFIPLKANWKEAFPVDAPKTNSSSGETEDSVAEFYDDWHRQKALFSSGLAIALHELARARLP